MTRALAGASLILACVLGWPAAAQPQQQQQPAAATQADRVEHGRQVYEYWCATCHGRGRAFPGTNALQAKYNGAIPPVLEDRTDLTPAAVRLVVRRGVSIMPFFRQTEISDPDLDAIAEYLRRPRPATPAAP